jgi:hypothetical protein
MTIETKFDIGDVCYFMYDNKVKDSTIVKINFTKEKLLSSFNMEKLTYNVALGYVSNIDFEEDKLFPTKEDLLKSL